MDKSPTKPADTALAGVCAGTVAAALHYSTLLEAPYKSCPPKGATNGQAIEVVVRYLEAHPEVWDQDFSDANSKRPTNHLALPAKSIGQSRPMISQR